MNRNYLIAALLLLFAFRQKKQKGSVHILISPETFNPANNWGFGYPVNVLVPYYDEFYYDKELREAWANDYNNFVNANGGFKKRISAAPQNNLYII